MLSDTGDIQAAFATLVSAYRGRCLWFLRPNYTPTTPQDQIRVLGYIERYGDLEGFRRASTLRQWLLRLSSAASVS